ncbi:hypothetical protein CPAR01_13416 [Colletotrichum paranaense]|uniref:Uncharacterized protein n=1 Tax=Colletotrichum paranaense TaxID=1914294 RepID=A0ABQ9S5X4_9PEZI|nr:uncharacterized protein CPAR01_13416 [Colletotrichum paranaense]KAK1526888.1 hypothetical protein CPAR01_13416 [Colletotrichum paranaense]
MLANPTWCNSLHCYRNRRVIPYHSLCARNRSGHFVKRAKRRQGRLCGATPRWAIASHILGSISCSSGGVAADVAARESVMNHANSLHPHS